MAGSEHDGGSILTSIKEQLGIHETNTDFDNILIFDINTVFSILQQLGIGPEEPYRIVDAANTWSEFGVSTDMDLVRSYISLRVKEMFDPPAGVQVAQALRHTIEELEYRLHVYEGYVEGASHE